MLEFAEDERPVVAQVFGSDPAVVYDAVQAIEDTGVDIIDVNFGCPVKKVVKREAGSALLKNPPLLASVMRAAADAARRVPVTAKIRSGWNSVNAVEIARILEGIGAAAIAVHARTQSMGYSGNADWQVIADVKNALQIPVIGNGDVFTPQAAREMIDRTGCDLVMVARGAQGAPWLFAQINAEFRRLPIPRVTWHERIRVAAAHLALSLRQRPAIVAVRLFRSHIAHYTKGAPESAAFRGRVFCIDDAETVLIHLEEYAGFLERETPETSGSDCDKVFPASEAIPVATECHDDP
jgi:tRNA-dihydrouridine synthase B